MTNEDLLNEIQGSLDHIRAQLERFQSNQDDNSDEGNEDNIENATRALDDLEGHVGDLVP